MAKIFRSGNSNVVSLPQRALEELGLSVGDEVEVGTRKGKIELLPLKKKGVRISKDFAAWTEDFINRYKTVLDELAKK